MTTTHTLPKSHFAKDWRKFFASIHKQRTWLVDSGLSQKRLHRMQGILDRLQPYVNYGYNDVGTARFIIKHSADIRALIRETSPKTIERFDHFIAQANFLIEPEMQLS